MAGKDIVGHLLYLLAVQARPFVALLALAGLSGFIVLPLAERKNFFDENALLVGSARPKAGCA